MEEGVGMGEVRHRRPQRRLRQKKLFWKAMEDTATRMALGNPEMRGQVEALAAGQSIEFKFHNGGFGPARRTLVLKITRGLQYDVHFELRRGDHPGLQPNSQSAATP